MTEHGMNTKPADSLIPNSTKHGPTRKQIKKQFYNTQTPPPSTTGELRSQYPTRVNEHQRLIISSYMHSLDYIHSQRIKKQQREKTKRKMHRENKILFDFLIEEKNDTGVISWIKSIISTLPEFNHIARLLNFPNTNNSLDELCTVPNQKEELQSYVELKSTLIEIAEHYLLARQQKNTTRMNYSHLRMLNNLYIYSHHTTRQEHISLDLASSYLNDLRRIFSAFRQSHRRYKKNENTSIGNRPHITLEHHKRRQIEAKSEEETDKAHKKNEENTNTSTAKIGS